MLKTKPYTNLQSTFLVVLRLLIGWHLLYEGISKLMVPGWSSVSFLRESQWVMAGVAKWIISNDAVLQVVDFLNIWGLIAIGLGLILELFTRAAAISGAILVLIYYFNNAPIVGIEYSIPAEGNNLVVSKTLIEAISLCILAVFPTDAIWGLDSLISRYITRKNKK